MKKGIHPDYHEVTVKMTDGSTFKTRSTYGKKGDVIQLDVDVTTHPVWTGSGRFTNDKASKVAQFKDKYGSLGINLGGASSAKSDDKKTADKKDA